MVSSEQLEQVNVYWSISSDREARRDTHHLTVVSDDTKQCKGKSNGNHYEYDRLICAGRWILSPLKASVSKSSHFIQWVLSPVKDCRQREEKRRFHSQMRQVSRSWNAIAVCGDSWCRKCGQNNKRNVKREKERAFSRVRRSDVYLMQLRHLWNSCHQCKQEEKADTNRERNMKVTHDAVINIKGRRVDVRRGMRWMRQDTCEDNESATSVAGKRGRQFWWVRDEQAEEAGRQCCKWRGEWWRKKEEARDSLGQEERSICKSECLQERVTKEKKRRQIIFIVLMHWRIKKMTNKWSQLMPFICVQWKEGHNWDRCTEWGSSEAVEAKKKERRRRIQRGGKKGEERRGEFNGFCRSSNSTKWILNLVCRVENEGVHKKMREWCERQ